ncbi:hypothetical protein H2203_007900 [Taxawa tesnikishii (nom. ined.)]|nr:hypothetical protein H2203_007900 [Dothideales sp. JES 119]
MDHVRTAKALGLTSSLFLSGTYFASSQLVLPILYTRSPSTSTPIFSELYYRGAVTVVPLALFSASCSGYLAYACPTLRTLYAIAAVAPFATLPWTVLFMKSTNDRLNLLAKDQREQEKADPAEVTALLKKWTVFNYVRSGMCMIGGLAGLFALL